MTLKECYQAMDGGYDEVLGRLRSEERVQKFALKFLSDPSYESLCGAMERGSGEEAFRAAHTLKGICQNLSFTRLYQSSHALTEALRSGCVDGAVQLMEQVEKDYQGTTAALLALEQSL